LSPGRWTDGHFAALIFRIFYFVVDRRFCWGFGENACFVVVFSWSICGVMRDERGALATTFSGAKNTPTFDVYFLIFFGLFSSVFLLRHRLSCRTGLLRGGRPFHGFFSFIAARPLSVRPT
jgi:hypothetical protein